MRAQLALVLAQMACFLAMALGTIGLAPSPNIAAQPTLEKASAMAKAAAAEHDYRVYLTIGLGWRDAPGIACIDPRTKFRLGQRGWNEIPDTDDPPHRDAEPQAAELFNRTLAADKGFQVATRCRARTDCEDRFGVLDQTQWRNTPSPDFRLDRQCRSHPGQLIAAAASGSARDLDFLLDRAPASWERKDDRGRSVYDWGLIAAARTSNLPAVTRLLHRVQTGAAPIATPERPIEIAMLAALAPVERIEPSRRLAVARLLHANGARLTYLRGDAPQSLLTDVLGNARSHDPDRYPIVDWVLSIGADPNGPPCLPNSSAGRRGFEPLNWVLDDQAMFDRLVTAGARPVDAVCKTDDGRGGATLTRRAILRLANTRGAEPRRVAIKLLKLGGRVRVWGGDPLSIQGDNLEALSIIVAAAQLDGARDRVLRQIIGGSSGRSSTAAAAQQAQAWLTCPHADPVLQEDRALLCIGDG
jgi:hypothetical protein